MNRLTRILSALGVMGFAADLRESIENSVPEPDSIRSEHPAELSDPGDLIELEEPVRTADTIAVEMGDMVVGNPRAHEFQDT